MESWLFGETGLTASEISVEGWHKPGSLTLCSGVWIHAAGSAVLNAGPHAIDGHHMYVWLAVAEGSVSLNRPTDSLTLGVNDTCVLPASSQEACLQVETDAPVRLVIVNRVISLPVSSLPKGFLVITRHHPF